MSLIEAHGWDAVFTSDTWKDACGRPGTSTRPVVLWQEDDGDVVGLVVSDSGAGKMRAASSYSNFVGYRERSAEAPSAVVPAEPGWFVVQRDSSDSAAAWRDPVVAWSITDDGWIVRAIALTPEQQAPVFEEDGLRVFVHDPAAPRVAGATAWPVEDEEQGT